jgi:hypothetical protein
MLKGAHPRETSADAGLRGVRHDASQEKSDGAQGKGKARAWRRCDRRGLGAAWKPRPSRGDQESDCRVRCPRQGDGPHLASRDSYRQDGPVWRAEGDAAGLRQPPADRTARHCLFRRGGRGQAQRRGATDLYRMDVRREPRAPRGGAPRLRRLAHKLQDARRGQAC